MPRIIRPPTSFWLKAETSLRYYTFSSKVLQGSLLPTGHEPSIWASIHCEISSSNVTQTMMRKTWGTCLILKSFVNDIGVLLPSSCSTFWWIAFSFWRCYANLCLSKPSLKLGSPSSMIGWLPSGYRSYSASSRLRMKDSSSVFSRIVRLYGNTSRLVMY